MPKMANGVVVVEGVDACWIINSSRLAEPSVLALSRR